MCVIAKLENLYIKEFIDYYKNIKIKKIFLYDNNDIFGENFNKLLKFSYYFQYTFNYIFFVFNNKSVIFIK